MKILIVDDSKAMRMIVRRSLRQAGYGGSDVIEAASGAEALTLLDSETADLVLCDWNMPEMNGIDFLRNLRGKGSTIPFGFITSEGSEEMRREASEAGAAFLLQKPFTPEAFADILRTAGVV